MQTFSWYVRRLRAMSPDEIAWRARSAIRDATDRYRIGLKLYPRAASRGATAPRAPRWCPVPLGDWRELAADDPAIMWRARLIDQADRILSGHLSFFDLEDLNLGRPIDWNREHACNRPTPMGYSPSIDYRDYAVTGDCKVVWEPNRHHQLVVLGRAYRATGDERYAATVVDQIGSWIDACPFGQGMNWRSPLELGVRLVSWTWAIDLIAGSRALTDAFYERLLQSVALHVWDVARKYSRGSSANNHRIGEACGVFVAACYFPELPDAAPLRRESHAILREEIEAQTYPSGATREQAFGYHLFVLQLFLAAGIAGRRSDCDFPAGFWSRLQRMFAFAGAMAAGGPPPYYGDADDGYALDLGSKASDVDSLMQIAVALFGREPFHAWADQPSEPVHWLFGTTPDTRRRASQRPSAEPLESTAFADAGLYLLQSGHARSADRVSVVFDCGEHGFGSLAAHGHADALGLVVRAGGAELLVDPGTYDYFSFPTWRQYFRGTRAHNTVMVDGVDQSELLGLFLWGRRASARCLDWRPRPNGGTVAGEHDGYRPLADPVGCRRTIDLDGRTISIVDEIVAAGAHDLLLSFHLGADCQARADGRTVVIELAAVRAVLTLDDRLTVALSKGGDAPQGGWVSSGYHRRRPAWVIEGAMRSQGSVTIESRLEIVST